MKMALLILSISWFEAIEAQNCFFSPKDYLQKYRIEFFFEGMLILPGCGKPQKPSIKALLPNSPQAQSVTELPKNYAAFLRAQEIPISLNLKQLTEMPNLYKKRILTERELLARERLTSCW